MYLRRTNSSVIQEVSIKGNIEIIAFTDRYSNVYPSNLKWYYPSKIDSIVAGPDA